MKNRWESAETFGKYAELEAIDYMIRQEHRRFFTAAKLTPLEAAIDDATGYGKAMLDRSMEYLLELIEQKIACETFLEIDTKPSLEFRNGLANLISKTQ